MDFNVKYLLEIPPYKKILVVFLTLVGIWGAPGYEAPKFFTYMTTEIPFLRKLFQFLFVFILGYQGQGGNNFTLTFWSTLIFFILFEIVKGIEKMVWKDDSAQDTQEPAEATPAATPPASTPPAATPPAVEPFRAYY